MNERQNSAGLVRSSKTAIQKIGLSLNSSVLRPIRAFRLIYLPLLTIYFSYGAMGIIDVTRDMWVKERLTLSPAELAGIGVWLSLPWTIKMVFGELVDSVPIFGSQRRSYVLIGAALISTGLLILAGAAGNWIEFAAVDRLFVLGALLIVIGTVIQNVVAEAMSTEVVPRRDSAGSLRPDSDIHTDLGMVQVISRLALWAGILAVAGLSGWLASILDRETVFLIGLVIPAGSVIGIFVVNPETRERRQLDWRILGGGIAFGVVTLGLIFWPLPFGQELIFVISMGVICTMLVIITRELSATTRRAILYSSIVIFVYRSTPLVGDGYFWWTLDVLKFDEAFYGTLRQTAAMISIVAIWVFSKQLTEYPITKVLFWLAIAGTVFSLPNIGLFYGVQNWTEPTLGLNARSITVLNAAVASPFVEFSMIPLLTLIATYAMPGHRATWFALMGSLMNTALVAGQLQTKYLNDLFVVSRGDYTALGSLLIAVTAIGLIVPLAAIALFGRRI